MIVSTPKMIAGTPTVIVGTPAALILLLTRFIRLEGSRKVNELFPAIYSDRNSFLVVVFRVLATHVTGPPALIDKTCLAIHS